MNRELVRAEAHDRLIEETTRRRAQATPVDAAHTVAACMSAVLSSGLGEGDPQVPYWWTFEAIKATLLDSYTRSALETFFAVVTLCRGGVMSCDSEQLGELLETAFAALSPAVDVIIEHLSARGASNETVQVWHDILTYITNAELVIELVRDLGWA